MLYEQQINWDTALICDTASSLADLIYCNACSLEAQAFSSQIWGAAHVSLPAGSDSVRLLQCSLPLTKSDLKAEHMWLH